MTHVARNALVVALFFVVLGLTATPRAVPQCLRLTSRSERTYDVAHIQTDD
jgi:hypothetical protein